MLHEEFSSLCMLNLHFPRGEGVGSDALRVDQFTETSTDIHSFCTGMVDWYIASGCTGLFAVCQSSEMYHMTDEERLAVARAVVKQADGRVSD